MGILLLKSGLFTTVQDMGRIGYQKYGFSVSGVMDARSAKLANILIDNPENEAVLEFMMIGPKLKFTSPTIIAITGGNFDPVINDKPVPMYTAIYAHKDDILELKYAKTGVWGYIAFSGKLDIPVYMGSRSTNTKCGIGGFHGRKLKKEDQIWFRAKNRYLPSFLSRNIQPEDFSGEKQEIRVILGPQDDYFLMKGIKTFFEEEYKVTSDMDRMGYRLAGPYIAHKDTADIISDGIPLGAIQIPSHGQPIIMLADRQTIGGYAKIGTVISIDIPRFVQSREDTIIKFKKIDIENAQKLYRDEEKAYDKIVESIHHPCKEVLEPRQVSLRVSKLFDENVQEVEKWIWKD